MCLSARFIHSPASITAIRSPISMPIIGARCFSNCLRPAYSCRSCSTEENAPTVTCLTMQSATDVFSCYMSALVWVNFVGYVKSESTKHRHGGRTDPWVKPIVAVACSL